MHPILLATGLTPLVHLTLSRCCLVDGHLNLIQQRLVTLQTLDISFNKFTSDELLDFLDKVVRLVAPVAHAGRHKERQTTNAYIQGYNSDTKVKIRSINVAGNSLKDSNHIMIDHTLPELVKLTTISHLDFSLMDLQPVSLKLIVTALTTARSIQSIHLSGQRVKVIRQIVN